MVDQFKLDWKFQIENNYDKIEMWNIAHHGNMDFLVYAILETEKMNAVIEGSITKYHPALNSKEIVFFHKIDKTGLAEFLSKWIGHSVGLMKRQLEDLI